MGRRSNFMHDVRLASKKLGGSISSISNRNRAGELFADFLSQDGALPAKLGSVDPICLPRFAQYLQALYSNNGTLQNKIGAVRRLLMAAQVDISAYRTNKSLGFAPRSRLPGKLPFPDEQLEDLYRRAKDLNEGFMLCLQVERLLGARGLEALMSPKTLSGWIMQANQFHEVAFLAGTKGGRPRFTELIFAKRTETMAMIYAATTYMDANGGYLLRGPSKGLESARSLYQRLCRSIGLVKPYSGHSLRYAYCVDKLIELVGLGYTMSEASCEVAPFLGHGTGRGRYVKSVYGATVVETVKRMKVGPLLKRLATIAENRLALIASVAAQESSLTTIPNP